MEFLKRLDVFSDPVTLNFRGSSRYNTVGGGATTIITIIVLIYFTIAMFIELVKF